MPLFHCPSCGANVLVADDFAGKQIVCPACAQPGAVPTSADATPHGITTPELAHGPLRRADDLPDMVPSIREPDVRAGWFAWLTMSKVMTGLSICLIATCGIALLVPAPRRVREAAGRTQSANNLKQIGLAIHGFHDAHKRLPFNGSDLAAGGIAYSAQAKPSNVESGSWAFQILPYIDQATLFQKPDMRQGVAAYMCPGRGRPITEESGGAWCDYFLNPYVNDPLQAAKPDAANRRRTMTGVTDDTSHTIFVGHGNIDTREYGRANATLSTNIFQGGTFGTIRAGDNGERNPTGNLLRRDSAETPTRGTWGGPFPQGALMCLGDGTVRMFPYSTQNFGAFLTPAGKEEVALPDF